MFSGLMDKVGINIPAVVIDAVGKVVEVVGEVTDNETIKEVGKAIQENSDIISE